MNLGHSGESFSDNFARKKNKKNTSEKGNIFSKSEVHPWDTSLKVSHLAGQLAAVVGQVLEGQTCEVTGHVT